MSYYFAVSMDGYMARQDGRVDWLDPFHGVPGSPYDFEPYMATVAAVVMGRKTYDVGRALGPLPLRGRPGFVYTRQPELDVIDGVTAVTDDIAEHLRALRSDHDGRIWVLGGGMLATFLLENNLLDEIIMTRVPVTIGDGLSWVAPTSVDTVWQLDGHFVSDNGIVQLAYTNSG